MVLDCLIMYLVYFHLLVNLIGKAVTEFVGEKLKNYTVQLLSDVCVPSLCHRTHSSDVQVKAWQGLGAVFLAPLPS